MKTTIFVWGALWLCGLSSFAQNTAIIGKVLGNFSGEPIPGVELSLQNSLFKTISEADGSFNFVGDNLPLGENILKVEKSGYRPLLVPIVVQAGKTLNLGSILLELDLSEMEAQIGVISLSDLELEDDEGISYSVSGLLQAADDVFLKAAAYDFSATFFRPRGLDNANGKLLINGIEMNKQFDGRPQWANWGGLNDVQRNQEFSMGMAANDYIFGDVGGTTNIVMRASQYGQGGRVSYAIANRSYTGRVMGSYHSGQSLKGWAYSVLLSRRFGDEGFYEGTLYAANSFFVSAEKKLGEKHSLNLTAFYAANRRGRATSITQEVKDLKGSAYNPNWGYQNGEIRNSRIKTVEEPIIMLNHYWNLSSKSSLNTNIGYQFGKIGSTRIDYGGTRLINVDGQPAYIGGARNPYPNYYQKLPSYFLRFEDPSPLDYQYAYLAEQQFQNDGQLNWEALFEANKISTDSGGNSIYALQEDRTDDTQYTVNTIFNSRISEHFDINSSLNYRKLKSENFAELKDLLGGSGYLDIDYFAEGETNVVIGDVAQSDLQNRDRIVREGDRYKYSYELYADVFSGFAQGKFKYRKTDFFIAATGSQTKYLRNGLFENGNFPGEKSLGESESLSFTDYGVKAGMDYKISGRHIIDLNVGYFTKAPSLRNSFSNARQSNRVVDGLKSEAIQNADLSYIFRNPIVKARITGFYTAIKDRTEIGFYFTESAQGFEDGNAFVQEILTGIETQSMGGELGIEAQITPTLKLKAAAAVGQNVYSNNPRLYLTSEDFETLSFGDGTAKLKNYHVAGGPERAYQIGFEYSSPEFWWFGATANYFSNAYIDVSALKRSDAFSLSKDGQANSMFDSETAKLLLKQEQFDDYVLLNVVGGKSWRVKKYYVGFFASINNILDQEYVSGGFEDSRYADYDSVLEDSKRERPIFGSRYFFGTGTTYYINVYVRF